MFTCMNAICHPPNYKVSTQLQKSLALFGGKSTKLWKSLQGREQKIDFIAFLLFHVERSIIDEIEWSKRYFFLKNAYNLEEKSTLNGPFLEIEKQNRLIDPVGFLPLCWQASEVELLTYKQVCICQRDAFVNERRIWQLRVDDLVTECNEEIPAETFVKIHEVNERVIRQQMNFQKWCDVNKFNFANRSVAFLAYTQFNSMCAQLA